MSSNEKFREFTRAPGGSFKPVPNGLVLNVLKAEGITSEKGVLLAKCEGYESYLEISKVNLTLRMRLLKFKLTQ